MSDKHKPQDVDDVDAYELVDEDPQPRKPAAINPTLFLDDAPAEKPDKGATRSKSSTRPEAKPPIADTPSAHPKLVDPLELARKREEGRRKLAEQQAIENARKFKIKMVMVSILLIAGVGVWIWMKS